MVEIIKKLIQTYKRNDHLVLFSSSCFIKIHLELHGVAGTVFYDLVILPELKFCFR